MRRLISSDKGAIKAPEVLDDSPDFPLGLLFKEGKEMPRWGKEAPNFRAKGKAREFITKSGRTYLLLGFSDKSGLVLRKAPSKGKATARFIPVRPQKPVLRSLGASEAITYEMIWELLK